MARLQPNSTAPGRLAPSGVITTVSSLLLQIPTNILLRHRWSIFAALPALPRTSMYTQRSPKGSKLLCTAFLVRVPKVCDRPCRD